MQQRGRYKTVINFAKYWNFEILSNAAHFKICIVPINKS